MNSMLPKLVARLASWYSSMPVKPFRPILLKVYNGYKKLEYRKPVIKKIDGIRYELDLREVIDNAMYFKGTREPGTSHALKKLCKPGDIVIDIGANVGSHALPMASYVGDAGKVYAFEPVPWALAKLKRNLALNKFSSLVAESIALSDVNDEVEMKFRASFRLDAKSGVGTGGKIDDSWWDECDLVKVRMETLDHYAASHSLNRVDLIKLDVDGFEGKVIRGAMQTLRRYKPVIIMEIAPAWLEMRGDKISDVLKALEALGYRFYTELEFKPIENLVELIEALPPEGGFNVLASVGTPGMTGQAA